MANIKPAHLKELNGSAKHNPDRVNNDQPIPKGGIGPAPDHFKKAECKIWDEMVRNIYAGVMGEGDRISFEILVKLFYRFRFGHRKTVLSLSNPELGQLIKLCSLFGMTPVDRQRIKIPKTAVDNPFKSL